MEASDAELARQAVDEGARSYFAACHGRVTPFVGSAFLLVGTLRLHRVALGWDIARAPLNLFLAPVAIALALAGAAIGRVFPAAGRALRRPILLRTAVSREIEWLVTTELLCLPCVQPGREAARDGLTEAILAVPAIQARMQQAMAALGGHGEDPAFRERLAHAIGEYGVTRAAAAEITTGLLNLGAGGLALHKLTPGAATLGPALAGTVAQQAAIGAFPLGGWLGGVWYGWFPAAPSGALIAGATAGLMLGAAAFAAFAGVVSDPIQRALGLHRARLHRMIDAIERQFFDPGAARYACTTIMWRGCWICSMCWARPYAWSGCSPGCVPAFSDER